MLYDSQTTSSEEPMERKQIKKLSTLCRIQAEASSLVAVRKDASPDASIVCYLNGQTTLNKSKPFEELNGYTKVSIDANGSGWIRSDLISEA